MGVYNRQAGVWEPRWEQDALHAGPTRNNIKDLQTTCSDVLVPYSINSTTFSISLNKHVNKYFKQYPFNVSVTMERRILHQIHNGSLHQNQSVKQQYIPKNP